MNETHPITNAVSAVTLLRDQMHELDHEEAWAIFLTSSLRPIGSFEDLRGKDDGAVFRIRPKGARIQMGLAAR